MTTSLRSLVLAAGVSVLAGCAQPTGYIAGPPTTVYTTPQPAVEYGTVLSVQALPGAAQATSGAGVALGGVMGGVLGNQVGQGGGRALATMIGIVVGAIAGNAVEARGNRGAAAYHLTIGMEQGGQRTYEVPAPGDLRPGDRVRVVNGQISRL